MQRPLAKGAFIFLFQFTTWLESFTVRLFNHMKVGVQNHSKVLLIVILPCVECYFVIVSIKRIKIDAHQGSWKKKKFVIFSNIKSRLCDIKSVAENCELIFLSIPEQRMSNRKWRGWRTLKKTFIISINLVFLFLFLHCFVIW